jgi:hypothetical protein
VWIFGRGLERVTIVAFAAIGINAVARAIEARMFIKRVINSFLYEGETDDVLQGASFSRQRLEPLIPVLDFFLGGALISVSARLHETVIFPARVSPWRLTATG